MKQGWLVTLQMEHMVFVPCNEAATDKEAERKALDRRRFDTGDLIDSSVVPATTDGRIVDSEGRRLIVNPRYRWEEKGGF